MNKKQIKQLLCFHKYRALCGEAYFDDRSSVDSECLRCGKYKRDYFYTKDGKRIKYFTTPLDPIEQIEKRIRETTKK